MASRWEISDKFGCTKQVYANSLIGLGEFDDRYLTGWSQAESFDNLDSMAKAYFLDDLADFCLIDLQQLHEQLYLSRPLFEVALDPVEPIERGVVGIWMHAKGNSERLFELDSSGRRMVSKSDSVVLGEDAIDEERKVARIPLSLVWNHAELLKLEVAQTVNLDLELRFTDGSSRQQSISFDVHPVAEVEHIYPWGLGFSTCVNETHPWIADFMGCIQRDPKVKAAGVNLVGGGGDSCGELITCFLLWREFVKRGVVYSNLTGASPTAQRVRQFHEVFGSRTGQATANCVDGSAAFASLASAQEMKSCLILVPGHCFVACGGVFLETTFVGASEGQLREKLKKSNISLEAFLEDMWNRKSFFAGRADALAALEPFRQEVAFKSFCMGWFFGTQSFEQEKQKAAEAVATSDALLAEWDALPAGNAKDAKWEEWTRAIDALPVMRVCPTEWARAIGVKPIQPPQNIGPLPK